MTLAIKTIAAVLAATLAVASADLAWSRVRWRRDNRMSKQELKEELKQAEGDRMIKARLRSLRLDRSRKRMLSAVPRATMVVANPTHYAVAMRYVRSEGGAPLVVAKGADLIALKIRAIAEAHDIPVVEDKPLARSLYAAVEVDRPIPADFYRAVAEIVHLIQQRKDGMGPPRTLRATPRARQRGPLERERIIADALVDVASELRLTDAAELILMIRNDHAANIADLVNSSTELFYKSGTLRYALSASFKAPWDATPVVADRHGVSSRHGVGLLSADDRSAARGGRDHRHSVRRAGSGRPCESGTPAGRLQERASSPKLARPSRTGRLAPKSTILL